MLVIDASLIGWTLGQARLLTSGCLNCKTWSVGFLPLFILFYLIFWNLSMYYAASSRSSFLRARRGERKGTMEERLPSFLVIAFYRFSKTKKQLRDCSQCKQTLFEAHRQCNFILMAESFSESSFFASQSPSQYIYWSLYLFCQPEIHPIASSY